MGQRKDDVASHDCVRAMHVKTGKLYTILNSDVIECTNGREELRYVVYTDGSMVFCRERKEFWRKFKPYFDDFVY